MLILRQAKCESAFNINVRLPIMNNLTSQFLNTEMGSQGKIGRKKCFINHAKEDVPYIQDWEDWESFVQGTDKEKEKFGTYQQNSWKEEEGMQWKNGLQERKIWKALTEWKGTLGLFGETESVRYG